MLQIERLRQSLKDSAAGKTSVVDGVSLSDLVRKLYTMLRLLTNRRTAQDMSKAAIQEQVLQTRNQMEVHSGKLNHGQLVKLQTREAAMLATLQEVWNEQELSHTDLAPYSNIKEKSVHQ